MYTVLYPQYHRMHTDMQDLENPSIVFISVWNLAVYFIKELKMVF